MLLVQLGLALVGLTIAAPNNLTLQDHVKTFGHLPNFYHPLEKEESFVDQAKKSILAVVGYSVGCEPGWTGQYCENPICDTKGTADGGQLTSIIDLIFLENSCDGSFYVAVDTEAANSLMIHVTASGVPVVNLTNAAGVIVEPEVVRGYDGGSLTSYSKIQPGGYSLSVDNQKLPTSLCLIEVDTYSTLKVSQGFVRTPQGDNLENGESAIDGVPSYFVAHAINTPQPAQISSVTIRQGYSLNPIYRSVLTKRYGCAHEYYAGQWTCSLDNQYFYHVDGVDANGNPFRRTGTFSCMEQLTTPAPPVTTPKPINVCYNNGSLLSSTNTCFCPELFTGNQCEDVQCMNGGIPDPVQNQVCGCMEGFSGRNCEKVTCDNNYENYLVDYKTLVVVLRDSQSMNSYYPVISKAVDNEINHNAAYDSDVYKGFVLVRYFNGSYKTAHYAMFNSARFISDIAITSTNVGGCSDQTFDAIGSVFSQAVYQKSPIFFFTDAVPSDPDNWQTVTNMNSRQKLPIYSFLFGNSKCTVDPMSPEYRSIQAVSFFSGGLILQPTADLLLNTFQTVMKATTYKMNQVLADDLGICSTPTRVFFVDSSTTDLIILATGEKLVAGLTDPNGNVNTLIPIIASGSTFFYEVITPVIGEHLLTFSSQSPQTPCSYRVMARSEYDLFFGTSDFVNQDAMDSEPVVGKSHHFVAQLNGLKDNVQDQFRLFAELTITTNINLDNQYQKPMYYSNGIYRTGCGYHLYFGAGAFCEFDQQPFYATVYADDSKGYTIQRTAIGYCSAVPTTVTPPTGCQNGGVPDPSGNVTCICPTNFAGKYCEQITCQNGGTPAGNSCKCAIGTGGTFCEQYACENVNTPDVSFEKQTMTFIISARTSMQAALNKLSDGIQTFVRDAQQQSNTWITRWILIVANFEDSTVLVDSSAPSDFAAGVQLLASNLSMYSIDAVNCEVQLAPALLTAASSSSPRSSIWVFADSSGPLASSLLQTYTIVTENHISVNLVGVGNSICTENNPTDQFPDYLTSLSLTSMGDIYMTSQVDQVLFFIISMYKSAISHRYSSNDCTNGITYYMPVDGWTQSMTLAVTGPDLLSVAVSFPDNTTAKDSEYEIEAINGPELKLYQFIAACDGSFWNPRQQSCYKFLAEKYDWSSGWNNCHQSNGALLHITNQDDNNYVFSQTGNERVWIGLVRNNGQWYWDVPDGNQRTPLGTYSNWANGVDPNNPSSYFVVMNADGKWEPANMTEKNFIGCQKHRYGQGLTPGKTTSLIPAGLWKITVQSNSGSCAVQARSQSDIQVFFGFVQSPQTDYPDNFANIQSTSNYMISQATGVGAFDFNSVTSLEGRLNYAVLSYNNSIINSLPFSNRWKCGYPYISAPFACPNSDSTVTDLSVKFTGIDQYGYAFERYSEALCTKQVMKCYNDGVLNNGKCVCRENWAGDTCQTPICQNGGGESRGSCYCRPQFTGTFCENAICEVPYPATFKDNGRTLVIALETSYNMGATIFQLKKNLKAALNQLTSPSSSTPGWFGNFILYPFDSASNKEFWYPVVESTNSDDIVAAVQNISSMQCPGPNPCSSQCPRPVVGVLQSILNLESFQKPNSVILFITRSSAEDYLSVGSIAQQVQEAKAYINFVYPGIDSPCGAGWGTSQDQAIYRIINYSQGNIFTMNAYDVSANFIPQYIPTLYSSAGLANIGGNCSYQEIMFQVEHEMSEFTIDFQHKKLDSIWIYNPQGEVIDLAPNIIGSDTNYVSTIKVDDEGITKAGTYRAVIFGSGGDNCYFSVRGRSSIEIYLGFVESAADNLKGLTNDNAYYAPVVLEQNTIVVHAEGLGAGVINYAQVIIENVGLVHTTTLKKRDSKCSYEWVSVEPYEYDYDHYFVVVYGQDAYGAFFRRNFYVATVGSRPPAPPPPALCDLSIVKQDTLFIIDSSVKNSTVTFSILKQLAALSMSPYGFRSGASQAAAFTLADKAYWGFSFNAGENSYDRVSELVMNLSYAGTEGQNFTDGLQQVINYYDKPAQGIRNSTDVKHLLVYLTNTNPTDVDPNQLLSTVKESGQYNVIVIALDMVTKPSLTKLVSKDCFYYAQDYHDLMNFGVNFIQIQSCMNVPLCNK